LIRLRTRICFAKHTNGVPSQKPTPNQIECHLRSSRPSAYGNGVHYDVETQRRPLLHQLVADEVLPLSYATDDGVGLVYEGTELVEAVSDRPGAAAYRVERSPDGTVVESRVEPRLLPGAVDAGALGL
jgi:hypothetical protein